MGNLIMTLLKIIILILLLLVIIEFVFGIISSKMCKEKCGNSVAYEVIGSGNFDLDDTCICFYEDGIKTIKLGKS